MYCALFIFFTPLTKKTFCSSYNDDKDSNYGLTCRNSIGKLLSIYCPHVGAINERIRENGGALIDLFFFLEMKSRLKLQIIVEKKHFENWFFHRFYNASVNIEINKGTNLMILNNDLILNILPDVSSQLLLRWIDRRQIFETEYRMHYAFRNSTIESNEWVT